MDRRSLVLLSCMFSSAVCTAQSVERQELIRQVDAEDALAKVLEHEAGIATPPREQVIADRLAYDQALKAAVHRVPSAPEASADLAELNDYQLRQAILLLHAHNIELYVALSKSPAIAKAFATEQSIQNQLATSATTRPARSATMAKYLNPPVILERTTMDNLDASAQRHSELEAQEPSEMTPDQLLAAVLSGQQFNRTFGVPSTIAPVNGRTPGSHLLNEVLARTLPLSADVPGTVAMRADPPGNPSEVIPKPEDVSRLVNALGVSPDIAGKIATGQMTLAEAMQGSHGGAGSTELVGGLVPNDPRWQAGYYGNSTGFRNWQIMSLDAFEFRPGGGRYARFDLRINNSPDMRTNSEPDRRINVNNDRRVNVQVDPRVNY